MKTSLRAAVFAALASTLFAGSAWSQATQSAGSVDLEEAIKLLSSGSNASTEEALNKLQAAIAQQSRQTIIAQQLMLRVQSSLAQQLKVMTGTSDAQIQSRVAGLLEFNDSIYRWAIDAAALPDEQRNALYDWGVKDNNLLLVARIFGRDLDTKTAAIRELAAQPPSAATDQMMMQLIQSKDRDLSLLAMDSLFERKATLAMVDAISDKAFGWIINQNRGRVQNQHTLNLHGRQMVIYDNQNAGNNTQDMDFAVDLLIKFDDPHVAENLNSLLSDLALSVSSGNINDSRVRSIMSPNYSGAQAMTRLIDAYKPKGVIPLCLKVLEAQPTESSDPTININGTQERYHYSTRVDAMAMLVSITSQDPNDYGLVRVPNYNNRWMIRGTAQDENEMIRKFKAWSAENGKKFGIDAGNIPDPPGGTRPATRPAGGAGMP